MKDKHDITTGEGNTVRVLQDSPYLMRLTKGWNQIGNPYNFNLYWPDVKAFPGNAGKPLGDLKVYEAGKFGKSEVLKNFRGGLCVRGSGNGYSLARRPE